MTLRLTVLTLALSALAACGDGEPDAGPATADQIRASCERFCEHRFECGDVPDEAVCVTDCVADTPTTNWIRGDALVAVSSCQADLACDSTGGDACFGACEPTSAHDRFAAQCRETMAACWTPEELTENCAVEYVEGVSDTGILCLIVPSIMDEATACMPDGTACEAALDCVQGVFERHGIDL